MESKPRGARILSIPCKVVAALAVLSTLWFIPAHALNATNAGWGDVDQDRHQWWLGYGIRISVGLAVISIGLWVSRSKRVLISILSGVTVSGLLVLVAPKLTLLYSTLGLPGFFAAMRSEERRVGKECR